MRVEYLGEDRGEKIDGIWIRKPCRYRFAIVGWTPKEEADAQEMVRMMYEIGWDYDGYDECAWFPVEDRDEYRVFMDDWKEAKKELKKRRTRK